MICPGCGEDGEMIPVTVLVSTCPSCAAAISNLDGEVLDAGTGTRYGQEPDEKGPNASHPG
jgi:hypothetical protein